jgi:hypothetical protein
MSVPWAGRAAPLGLAGDSAHAGHLAGVREGQPGRVLPVVGRAAGHGHQVSRYRLSRAIDRARFSRANRGRKDDNK